MSLSKTKYNFQDKTSKLGELSDVCSDWDRLAQPYLEAAAWERENGREITEAVGLNSAIDMDAAAMRLIEIREKCSNCGGKVCQFAGVEKPSPTELLELSEVEG